MLRHALPALAVGLALTACGQPQPQQKMPPPWWAVTVIKEQPVTLTAELPGRTSPFAVSEVRPQVSGIIQKRLFVEGSTVKKGQPLYQIDPAPYQAAYDNAEATLASTKVKAERYAALLARERHRAPGRRRRPAAYLQAKANADAARINLNYTRITAPITGRIGASTVTEGALVTAQQATALATISTLDPIYVDVDQSSAELLALRARRPGRHGQPSGALTAEVTLKLDDGSTYPLERQAAIHRRDGGPDHRRGAPARHLPQSRQACCCRACMSAPRSSRASIRTASWCRSRRVSHNEKGEPTALVVDDKNIARLRVLKTGRAVGGNWQVLDGLKPGDR